MAVRVLFKSFKAGFMFVLIKISYLVTIGKFPGNGVKFFYDFEANGIPVVNVNLKGILHIGKHFQFNSGLYYNMIGRQQPCFFIVGSGAKLIVGNHRQLDLHVKTLSVSQCI